MLSFRAMLCNSVAMCLLALSAQAASPPLPEEIQASVEKGIRYLKTTQSDDGGWGDSNSMGVTGLVTYALLESGVPVDDPAVKAGLKYIEKSIQPDGGIYRPESLLKNYETSIAIQALAAANKDGRYQKAIADAVKFVKELQWDDAEAGGRENLAYGGAGYGKHARPDLSNTAFFLDALKAAGVSSHDPAMQNALLFISRCQNLPGANDTKFADKVNDGGFYYTPAAGGSSFAGETPDGGLRSYGSITYAGLKSMIYAGLTEEDPRVKAAQEWIRRFYSLDENPGVGQQGLFYYYVTFAKTMEAIGKPDFTDANGHRHDWRGELARQLIDRQKPNGSWVNGTERWMEGDPNLVTAYSLIALSRCRETSAR